jgi:SAM-dependent methyltransferase
MSSSARSRAERIAALGYAYADQPLQTRGRCNLCGHDRFVTVAHRDRYGYPARAQGCLRCGLVFLDPALTPDAYAKFYRDVYRPLVSAYHARRIDAETIEAEQRDYARRLGEALAPWLARRGATTLLDVGGSTGVVAHHLSERFDLAATVIDPAPLEIERARRLGLRTVSGFVEDFGAGGETFDLVLMCQTVDHLLDVAGTLHKIRALLSERGLFFVDIVDFRAACRRQGSVEEAVKIDHPYSLTQATIEAYLRRAGFETLAIDYAEDHLHVGYLCEPGRADPEACVPAAEVAAQWRELRAVQNPLPAAPGPGAKR